jgi:hypothetical protein
MPYAALDIFVMVTFLSHGRNRSAGLTPWAMRELNAVKLSRAAAMESRRVLPRK